MKNTYIATNWFGRMWLVSLSAHAETTGRYQSMLKTGASQARFYMLCPAKMNTPIHEAMENAKGNVDPWLNCSVPINNPWSGTNEGKQSHTMSFKNQTNDNVISQQPE